MCAKTEKEEESTGVEDAGAVVHPCAGHSNQHERLNAKMNTVKKTIGSQPNLMGRSLKYKLLSPSVDVSPERG